MLLICGMLACGFCAALAITLFEEGYICFVSDEEITKQGTESPSKQVNARKSNKTIKIIKLHEIKVNHRHH